jgi:prepilin-type N-terminal cleavage/methylation domain-containing protein
MNKLRVSTKGFTLAEIVVVVGIFVLVAGIASQFQLDTWSFRRFFQVSVDFQAEGLFAMKNLTRELRSMTPSVLGTYPIAAVGTSTLTFYADADGNGQPERLRYYISNNTLFREEIDPCGNPLTYATSSCTASIKRVVQSLRMGTTSMFTYYDSSYTGTTSPLAFPPNISSIRLIKVTTLIENDPNKSPLPLMLTTQVTMRNLKDNQ